MNPQRPPGYPPLPPPPYQLWQQGHAAPVQSRSYKWLIPSLTAAGGLVLGGIIVGAATSGTTAGPAPTATVTVSPVATRPQGYHDPSALESALKSILAKRLANPSGQYYLPGVTVKSVLCVETSKTAATCLYKLSGGQSDTVSVVISADGGSFISK